jgi:hypothetical protein
MKNFIRLFVVICVFLILNTNSFAAINKGRINRHRDELSSVFGLYHAELTFDFSRGWNNPTHSYRVLKNELGLNVSYNLSRAISYMRPYLSIPWYYYTGRVFFNINNRDFSPVGKTWYLYATPIKNGPESNIYASVDMDFGSIMVSNRVQDGYKISFVVDKNIEIYRTDSQVILSLIITDYLWDKPYDKGIDRRKKSEPPRRDTP